jgi:hypothetical protein
MEHKFEIPIAVREIFPEEHNFVLHSWIKSGQRSNNFGVVAKELYTLNQHEIITSLLTRSKILVAQELDKPESLYGYIVYDLIDGVFTLHYAYVKQFFRGLGVLKALLSHANFSTETAGFYTHHTKICDKVMPSLNLMYNPYLLINPKFSPLCKNPEKKLVELKITDLINGDKND